ncbi:MAG: metal ABC transporter substrate-binding protein, partial [Halobacteriales archaeon]
PLGQHGHGWEPSPDVQRSVDSADVLVYVTRGFQPWVDDILENVDSDNPDLHVVEAAEAIDLLGTDDHGDTTENEDYSNSTEGEDQSHDGEDDDQQQEGNESHQDDHDEDDDHDDVNDVGDGDEENDGDGHENHGEDGDPHFWLDPVRARRAVDNLASGLAEADDTEGYQDNAALYKSRLDELHEEFETTLESRSKDVVFVAGHDAFQYLGNRYDFDVVTLSGLSPDERPTARDVERAHDVIDTEGIRHVLTPVFESDTAARTIVEDTSAEETLPVTALPTFKDEWLERDWGYLEVQRNVNLDTLEKALEA